MYRIYDPEQVLEAVGYANPPPPDTTLTTNIFEVSTLASITLNAY